MRSFQHSGKSTLLRNLLLLNFEETVRFNEATCRYQVRLPWKDNTMSLPPNLRICKKRLRSLLNRLNKDGRDCIVKYDEAIREQREKGFIEKVDDTRRGQGILHYIPHLPVFKEDSATTKMRIVYDASARGTNKTPSMNDCLQIGPCLLKALLGILLRFRLHKYAFTADIEKAFLQIELNGEYRDATRFLWLKDLQNQSMTMKI